MRAEWAPAGVGERRLFGGECPSRFGGRGAPRRGLARLTATFLRPETPHGAPSAPTARPLGPPKLNSPTKKQTALSNRTRHKGVRVKAARRVRACGPGMSSWR